MNHLLTKSLFASLSCAALLLPAQARDFNSNDGSKTLTADFVRFNARTNQVTLRLADGRNMVADAGFFSEKDQAFFVQEGKSAALDDALRVDADKKSDHISQDYGQMKVRRKKISYSFEVKNTSAYALKGLKINYWVVVDRNQGKSKNQIIKGSTDMTGLEAGEELKVSGPEMTLTMGARSTCDCPKVAEAAAKIGRDDIVGERVEITNAKGKVIYADSSSKRVDQALGLK